MTSQLPDPISSAMSEEATGSFPGETAAAKPAAATLAADQATRRDVVAVRGSATRCLSELLDVDLVREGSNMWALTVRQSRCLTPLTISSRATQDMLRQF